MKLHPRLAPSTPPTFSSSPSAPQSAPLAKRPPGFPSSSGFEVDGSKQSQPRRASPTQQRIRNITPARLRELNPTPGDQNCPATAAALDHYLRTGEVRPAPRGDSMSTFRFPMRLRETSLADLSRLRPGEHAVVRGTRSQQFSDANRVTPEHWFVVANGGNGPRVIDAFNHDTGMDPRTYMQQQGFQRLHRYQGPFVVQHQPFNLDGP